MRYALIVLSCFCILSCSSSSQDTESGAKEKVAESESPQENGNPFEGRHAPTRGNSDHKFVLSEETEIEYRNAQNQRALRSFSDREQFKDMKQGEDLCWDIPLENSKRFQHCPSDVDQFKLDYIGRFEERDALVFDVGISGFQPLTQLVELEAGWVVELEGYLHISPGGRWAVGIANEPLIWVGMYIYDAAALNYDRVFEVGAPGEGYADAFHQFDVSSPVWVSDSELHLFETVGGVRKYYVLNIEEAS